MFKVFLICPILIKSERKTIMSDPLNFNKPAGTNPASPSSQQFPPGVFPKNKIAAGVLGILLGAFGIHNFYLGYNGKGLVQLLITVLSFGFLSFISATWGLIEGILILVSHPDEKWGQDARGYNLV